MRKLEDAYTRLQGLTVYNARGIGTGSGPCSLFLAQLSVDFGWEVNWVLLNYPIPSSCRQLWILVSRSHLHSLLEHMDVVVMLDDEAIGARNSTVVRYSASIVHKFESTHCSSEVVAGDVSAFG